MNMKENFECIKKKEGGKLINRLMLPKRLKACFYNNMWYKFHSELHINLYILLWMGYIMQRYLIFKYVYTYILKIFSAQKFLLCI